MADVANEAILLLFDSIAQSNQVTPIPASPAPILTLHSLDLNTHSQIEANIILIVDRVQETSSRNNVMNRAPLETNIMQKQQQPQFTPLSSSMNFALPAQINAPNRARQLSQTTMKCHAVLSNNQIDRKLSMPGTVQPIQYHSSTNFLGTRQGSAGL